MLFCVFTEMEARDKTLCRFTLQKNMYHYAEDNILSCMVRTTSMLVLLSNVGYNYVGYLSILCIYVFL